MAVPDRLRRLLAALMAGVLLTAALVATRSWWLPLPSRWLDVSSSIEPADAIVVMSGNSLARAKAAAKLYREHYASRLLVTGGGESELLLLVTGERLPEVHITGRMLARLGVPLSAITLVSGVTSTSQDGEAISAYVRSHRIRSAIIVTSHLHSRRARLTLGRALAGLPVSIQFVEAEQADFVASRWWHDEDGVITVVNEYLKFGYYLLQR